MGTGIAESRRIYRSPARHSQSGETVPGYLRSQQKFKLELKNPSQEDVKNWVAASASQKGRGGGIMHSKGMDNNMPHPLPGRIAVMGGGSWATALCKTYHTQ